MENLRHTSMVLTHEQTNDLLKLLQQRIEKNPFNLQLIDWESIKTKLLKNPSKLTSLYLMEDSGGEPNIIGYDKNTDVYIFCDCSTETPKGRRSFCYDHKALTSRKEHKPKDSALNAASQMGIDLLTESQYHDLQRLAAFDLKTSSWLQTPEDIRNLGGAIFGDRRFGRVFIYHNGAESYYAVRGFRGRLTL